MTFAVVVVDALAPGGFGERQGGLFCGQIQERVLHKQTHHAAVPGHPTLRPQAQRRDLHTQPLRRLTADRITALLHTSHNELLIHSRTLSESPTVPERLTGQCD